MTRPSFFPPHKSFPSTAALAALVLLLVLSPAAPAAQLDLLPALQPPSAPVRPMIHIGLASAVRASSADNALILLVFETSASPECRDFDKKTLAAPVFTETGGPLHVAYFDLETAPKTAAQFQVSALPDLVLMTSEMKIVARTQGVLSAEDLMKWVDRGRRRVAHGSWEGIALDDESGRSSPADPGDYKRLVQDLGSSSAVERASLVLEAQGAWGVSFLLDGLEDQYLGVRIGASELIRKLAPSAPLFDPWDLPDARKSQLSTLRAWWKDSGKLPAVARSATLTPEEERAAQQALKDILSQEPVVRTRAMTSLVRLGPPVLPHLRDSVRKAAEAADLQTLAVLEDVRWAVLIPDRLEETASARRVLARGTSEERQAAALRLGAQGAVALAPLRELIDDSDTLVRESTVHALRLVRSDDSVAATAILLKAKDTNLRMVAAQALGNSKNALASEYLVSAVSDPDEVVACAAIAALEEVKAKNQAPALAACLKDKRWRVRAAAAEAIGKLEIKSANANLLALLDDEDPFVVKSALTALRSTGGLPDIDHLRSLAKRSPDLTGIAVNCLAQSGTATAVNTITAIYDESDDARRRDVLDGLVDSRYYGGSDKDPQWKPFLDKVALSKDPAARLKFVAVLQQRSAPTASPFVSKLLADDDLDVRAAAARLVLKVASVHLGVAGWDSMPDYNVLKVLDAPRPATSPGAALGAVVRRIAGEEAPPDGSALASERLKRAREVLALHRQWHDALKPVLDQRPDLPVILAFYVTGDGKTDIPVLASIPERKALADELKKLDGDGIPALVRRLPLPEGEPTLQSFSKSPVLYCALVSSYRYASPAVKSYIASPDRLVPAFETFKGDNYSTLVRQVLGYYSEGLTIFAPTLANFEVVKRLVASPVPAARAFGVYVVGNRKAQAGDRSAPDYEPASAEADTNALTASLADENPWVRYAAVQGIMALISDQPRREELLAPLLADKNTSVAALAAVAILDPRLRNVRSLSDYSYFRFEDFVSPNYRYGEDRERPVPALVDRKPAFLDLLRRRLAEPAPRQRESDLSLHDAFVILLAQYGDFSGLEGELDRWKKSGGAEPSEILLVGLALTKDSRYLEPLKSLVNSSKDSESSDLREVLKWLEGVKGQEARDLRRDINRRIQSSND